MKENSMSHSNKESWDDVVESFREYPDTTYWNQWRALLPPLIDQAVREGYDELFRAGTSMHKVVFSTLDHHGLIDEPRVTLGVTADWKIQIHYSTANVEFASSIQNHTVVASEAFQMLTRYLQHLWSETVAEPIPAILRGVKRREL